MLLISEEKCEIIHRIDHSSISSFLLSRGLVLKSFNPSFLLNNLPSVSRDRTNSTGSESIETVIAIQPDNSYRVSVFFSITYKKHLPGGGNTGCVNSTNNLWPRYKFNGIYRTSLGHDNYNRALSKRRESEREKERKKGKKSVEEN